MAARVIIQKLENLDPHRGLAALLMVMAAPKGYKFQSMERKETTATVRWVRKEDKQGGLECPLR